MSCTDVEKNLNSFFKGTLKGKELRKTYYHLVKCQNCKEILFDEFSFYTTFNDLDTDLDFNYRKKLDELMEKTRVSIETKDLMTKIKYIIYSIIVCLIGAAILVVAVKVMY